MEIRANEVMPTAIGAATAVIVRTLPTVAAVYAPLDGLAATVTAASAANVAIVRAGDRVVNRELGGDAEGERVPGRGRTRDEGVERRRAARERGECGGGGNLGCP